MPSNGNGTLPKLLSQTGAFKETRQMTPGNGLIPYDLIVPFWSDGAEKMRLDFNSNEKIKFSPTGEWIFPKGTVFVKRLNSRQTKLIRTRNGGSKRACLL
ncbi:MAG: hypothetical protein WDM76_13535 [Limisphaerales bacterium]